jgi:RimJ/RimL family protein N-acetyltransferase
VPFIRVTADDAGLVDQAVQILNRARRQDDPDRLEFIPERVAANLRYGWDLEPADMYLYHPEGADSAVGVVEIEAPSRDNRHLVWAEITVDPDHRRQGHATAIMHEVIDRTRQLGRTTIWVGAVENDLGVRAFVEGFGFVYASHDARRHQVLAQLDHAAIERLHAQAQQAAADYVVERGAPPISDEVLEELVQVTNAINDAPMGNLTYEDEEFDLERLKAVQAAAAGREDTMYRVWARHRTSDEIGGHTVVVTNRLQPHFAAQGDTAVSRKHRGHRLGLLLKIEMMGWLAAAEPQLEVIETFNHADNRFMINVNEALGYRLSEVFAMYELKLDA